MVSGQTLTPRLQATLPGLGTGRAGLHEFYAAAEADASQVTAAMLGLALGSSSGPLLWVRHDFLGREAGLPYPPGLMEFGLDPARILFVRGQDAQSVLQAGLEGARCSALGAVLIELWGDAKALDLTASRRLSVAAKESGTIVLMARIAAKPCPSAAETRWEVRADRSRALAANAPGPPAFSFSLLRHRGGHDHGVWHWEWNRDLRSFENRASGSTASTPPSAAPTLSGLVVPVSFDGQVPSGNARAAQRQVG